MPLTKRPTHIVMDNESEVQVDAVEEEQDEQQLDQELSEDTTDWKAEAARFKGMASRYRSKLLKATEKKVESPKPEAPSDKKPEDSGLLQKAFLRSEGIKTPKEIELALTTAKKWGMEVDELVDDEDFKVKLEKLRTSEANATATSRIKGSPGTQSAVTTPAYWLAKGIPPTPNDIPDRKTRAAITREFMKLAGTSGKKFYND